MRTVIKLILGRPVGDLGDAEGFYINNCGVVIPDKLHGNLIQSIYVNKPENLMGIRVQNITADVLPMPTIILPSGAEYTFVWSDTLGEYTIIDSDLTDWMVNHFYTLFEFAIDGFDADPKELPVGEDQASIDDQDEPPVVLQAHLIEDDVRAGASNAELKSKFGLTAKESRELRKSFKDN